eukprot:558510-Pyramimonas_sp.AAC.1
MQRNETQRGEYYTSGVIKAMLMDGHAFKAIEVDAVKDFHVLGTPSQVEEFCATWPRQPAKRWCFDLDNTLVTHPTVVGDYSTCKPIPHMIKVLNELYDAGHHIIIHTARRMRTHSGNVPAVIADIGQVTMAQLKDYGIPYHEMCFGKPYAHFYVDDLAVDPLWTNQNVAKQTGYHPTAIKAGAAAHGKPSAPLRTEKMWYCTHGAGLAGIAGALAVGVALGAYLGAAVSRPKP